MVKDNFRTHSIQDFVETLGGKTLEKRVGIPLAAHAVDDIATVAVGIHHAVHGVDVVLAVAVDGNGDVAAALCLHQARQHGVLVAAVAALADADVMLVTGGQFVDDSPGAIL